MIFKNCQGELVDGDSASVVEALACREGLKLALRRKYSKVIFETDSDSLFSYLTMPKVSPNWKVRFVLYDNDQMLGVIQEKKFSLVHRTTNKAIDLVASQSREGMCPSGYLRQPPSSLVFVLSRDGLSTPPIP